MSSPKRPRPRLDAENRAFWTGGSEGRLNIMKCGDCGKFTHPPLLMCRHCQGEAMTPHAVSGKGMVETYTVNHQAWMPGLEVPFVIARVRLDDAPEVIITSNVINCPVDAVDFGDKVQVTFEEQDGIWYPLFEKAN